MNKTERELQKDADQAYREIQRIESWQPWNTVARNRAVDRYAVAAERLRKEAAK